MNQSAFNRYKNDVKLSKVKASEITPKTETSASFLHSYVIEGAEAIKRLKAEKEPEIKSNSERLAKKYADEANAPILAELNTSIKTITDNVRTRFNDGIDKRVNQNNQARTVPIRKSKMESFKTLQMLIDSGADISENDWKMYEEESAGYYNEEKVLSAYAKKKGVSIIPSSDPEKNNENCEAFRKMGNIAIDFLDHPDDSVTALSFLSNNPNSPLAKLIDDIDSSLMSIIPAEKLTVLQRLRNAKENAYSKNNVTLSVKIGSFIDRNMEKLATPEELTDALYAEAESFIKQGMSATKEV